MVRLTASLRKLIPLFDRVLIEKSLPQTTSKGGILIPEKGGRPVTGTVVGVGSGSRSETGQLIPPVLKVGDTVVIPDFGGTKVVFEEKELLLLKECEILAKVE